VRIASWNVNGLRACARRGFSRWLSRAGADVVCVQEVRAFPEQLPPSLARPRAWHAVFAPAARPGYSGVATYARRPPDEVRVGIGEERFDVEGRLAFSRHGALLVVNAYFPNGNGRERDLARIPYKLEFYRTLREHLRPLAARGERIVVLGDWNTAYDERDLARPRQNRETSGFRPEERAELGRWFEEGWVDSFRHYEQGGGHYSWWAQRADARARNVGWRIDLALVSPGAMPFLRAASIERHVLGSDHCPITVTFDTAVVR
jgi:exodeoxyribonuclease-3